MDLLKTLALNVMLELLKSRTESRKVYPQIAKLYVKIESLANLDQGLLDEIEHQRLKESKK